MVGIFTTVAAVGLTLGPYFANAQEPVPRQPRESASHARHFDSATPYMGVMIEAVPEILHKHLPKLLPDGEGVLVTQVTKDSPADKAGLKPFDVLRSYGDKTITSPELLTKWIREDKAGAEVSIGYVREAKAETCKVVLAEQPSPERRITRRRAFRLAPEQAIRRSLQEFGISDDDNANWESFDSIKLSRVKGDTWRAEIDYRTKDGKKQHNAFEGTREQLAKDISEMKDLPDSERQHLLRTINMHQPAFELHFPPREDRESDRDKEK